MMEVTVDRFGRIVLPKQLREKLGIDPGKRLAIEEFGQEIHLRPLEDRPDLRDEGGILVYFGEATGDLDKALEQVRERRYKAILG